MQVVGSPAPARLPPCLALRLCQLTTCFLWLCSKRKTKTAHRGARQKGAVLVDISPETDTSETVTSVSGALPAQVPAGVLDGKFRLQAEEVAQLQQELGVNEEQLLQYLIKPAASLARPPISAFRVG